jgi:hypothetical protein
MSEARSICISERTLFAQDLAHSVLQRSSDACFSCTCYGLVLLVKVKVTHLASAARSAQSSVLQLQHQISRRSRVCAQQVARKQLKWLQDAIEAHEDSSKLKE